MRTSPEKMGQKACQGAKRRSNAEKKTVRDKQGMQESLRSGNKFK
jgi:hypothetical protein